MPIEPPPSIWEIPSVDHAAPDDIVGLGADLEPGTVLDAYKRGLFPMPVEHQLAWWSPVMRGILPLENFRVTRSLRKSSLRYTTTINKAFNQVIETCAQLDRDGAWITEEVIYAYEELHKLGWAHSFETWLDNELVGGLYGIAIGGFFAGESMFHSATDASKVALMRLVGELRNGNSQLLDVQWLTPHLASLGAIEITRDAYLQRLSEVITQPLPNVFVVSS